MRTTLPNGKWRKRLKIKALPPFAELHKVGAENCKIFRDNPFIPKSIRNLLNQLLEDIQKNIKGPLFKELEKFIVQANSMETDKDHPVSITYQAMYNDFLRYCKSHTKTINEITSCVREYLLVDSKWS